VENGKVDIAKIQSFMKKVCTMCSFGHCRPASCRNGHASRTEYDKQTAKPQEVLLVVDAMLGQEAANIAKSFKEAAPVSGVILAKADGDELGGAALSVAYVSGVPILFMGTGSI